MVAPYTGAWIEIKKSVAFILYSFTSPPIRGRGLKYRGYCLLWPTPLVAPYTGAWIEIFSADIYNDLSFWCRPLYGGVD